MLAEFELRERYDRDVDQMPDIIEWVCSDKYLNRGAILYPRQATLLKLIFLQDELFTEYDRDVLGKWAEGFHLPEPGEFSQPTPGEPLRYDPTQSLALGITPDWEQRLQINKAEGRLWFREVLPVVGRRGSKGYLGALCGSRILAHYISQWDPQEHYGIARDKKLQMIVFAGKMGQARDNQWRDIVDVIMGSPWFQPLVSNSLAEKLTVYAPSDFVRIEEMAAAGINTKLDLATFEIIPKESTLMAGRGMAAFCEYFDEMAHIVATGANRSAEEVYSSSVPALDQFGNDSFIYTGSSPWQMTGQLYENYLQALSVDPITHVPLRPEMLMVQLESWDPYEDWQDAHRLYMIPENTKLRFEFTSSMKWEIGDHGGITVTDIEPITDKKKLIHAYRHSAYDGVKFNQLRSAHAVYDEQMARLERANPDTFRVERRSQWASVLDAYLDPRQIEEMFQPWDGRKIPMQRMGVLNIDYVAHGDPSVSGDNFGFAIAHAEGPDDQGLYHVVFDYLHAWIPANFPESRIDYLQVQEEIIDLGMRFHPSILSFDQFSSTPLMQAIRSRLNNAHLPHRVDVHEQTSTATLNWQMAETFKTALNLGLLHAPYHELFDLECRFLQLTLKNRVDHPTAGPCQTKDVFDAAANVVWHLIGAQMSSFLKGDFARALPSGSQAGGLPQSIGAPQSEAALHAALGGGTSRALTREQKVIARQERWDAYRKQRARSSR